MRKKAAKKIPKARKDTSSKKRKVVAKKKAVSSKRSLIPKTRNGGTWRESEFWQMIRSALRNRTRFWKPRLQALDKAKRPSQSNNKRLKWEYQCSICEGWHPHTQIEVHHEVAAGTLKCAEDLPVFVTNLFAEDGWVITCKSCHKALHKKLKEI